MLFGANLKFCITFKTNETGFLIVTRKYEHGFKVEAHRANFEGSVGIYLASINSYLVTDTDHIRVFDAETFREQGAPINVPLL